MDARLVLHNFNPANRLHSTIQLFLVLYQIVDVLVDLLSSLLLFAVCLQSVAFLICVIGPVHVLVGELQGLNLSGVVRGLGSLLSTPDLLVESGLDVGRRTRGRRACLRDDPLGRRRPHHVYGAATSRGRCL